MLTHNGGANLLTGNETLTTTDNLTWTLRGLAGLTGTLGGFVAFNDHVTGDNTHVNATAYVANGTASGLLKDVSTGLDTGVLLTITEAGVSHDNDSSRIPAAGPMPSTSSTDSSISRRPPATASKSPGPITIPTPSPGWIRAT